MIMIMKTIQFSAWGGFGFWRVYLRTQMQLFMMLCECVGVVNIECWATEHRRRDEEETSCCCCHICIIWRRNLLTPQLIYGRANSAQLTLSGANHLLHLYSLHPHYIIMNIMFILYASYYLSMGYISASTCCRVRMYIDHISLALNYYHTAINILENDAFPLLDSRRYSPSSNGSNNTQSVFVPSVLG